MVSEKTTIKVTTRTEILVIGGGITGTATAFYLTRYGHQVTLLERSQTAAEAPSSMLVRLWQNEVYSNSGRKFSE